MKKRTLLCKLLSLALCASMTVPSLSVPAYAMDGGVVQESEVTTLSTEEVQENEVTELLMETEQGNETELLTVTEDSMEELQESEEVTAQEESTNTLGFFENVEVFQNGFYLDTRGTFHFAGSDVADYFEIYLNQYDAQDNKLSSSYVVSYWQTEPGDVNLNRSSVAALFEETEYIRLEVKMGDIREVNEKITLPEMETLELSFEAKLLQSGVETVWFEVSGSGDMKLREDWNSQNITFALNIGTTEDRADWREVTYQSVYFQEEGEEIVKFTNLEENTTYYGEIVALVEEQGVNGSVRVFEQRFPIASFSTKPNVSYSVETVFPDAVWRKAVLERVGNSSVDTVTEAQLETVSYIDANRTQFETSVIKDLTGIQLLKGLVTLRLGNHEISDVTDIDWSALTQLNTLYLKGNELTKFPDLSNNTELVSWDLTENLFSKEELDKIDEKLPTTGRDFSYEIKLTKENQRTNGVGILTEDNYYIYTSGNHIWVKPYGYKSELPYTWKWYLDGTERAFENNYSNTYYLINTGLTEGSHSLKVELYQGDTKVGETSESTFEVVNQPIFVADAPYIISGDTRTNHSWWTEIYYNEQEAEISSAQLVDDNGKIYGQAEINYTNDAYREPRLEYFGTESGISENIRLQECNIDWEAAYYTTPAGYYNWKVTFTDGTTSLIEDAVLVVDRDEPLVTNVSVAGGYDSTGEYIYLVLYGANLEPEKYNYTVEQYGKNYPVSYVSSKPTYSGVVVKLKKEGWIKCDGNYNYEIQLAVDGGTEHTRYSEGYVSLISGIYYADFNKILYKMEIAITEDLACDGETIQVTLKKGNYYENAEAVAWAEAEVHNNVAYVEFLNEDGTPYAYENGYYWVEILGQYSYSISLYGMNTMSVAEVSDEVESSAVETKEDSSANCQEENAYTSQITCETVETKAVYDTEKQQETVEVKTTTVDEDLDTLEYDIITDSKEGNDIAKNAETVISEEVAAQEMETADTEKFIISDLYGRWNGDAEVSITMNSPSATTKDNYTLVMEDCNGITPAGLTYTYQCYNGYVTFTVKGLQTQNAAKDYFIKITHNTLGEPYNASGTQAYYTDPRGAYIHLSYGVTSSMSSNGRTTGISFYKEALPITLKVTKPYSLDVLKEIKITSASELTNGWYYFTKDFCDSLPDKDVLYCVTLEKGNGMATDLRWVLGYNGNMQPSWSYKVDKTTLYFNDETAKTATIEVSGNNKKPTFKTSNASAVTVKADANNPNKAVLTAVGVGSAEISITADGVTRRFVVNAARKATLENLAFNQSELVLGMDEVKKLSANVFPAETWSDDLEITFTTDNQNVVSIEAESSSEIIVRGLQEGSATITATVAGTNVTAQCKVTVEKVFSEEEKVILIADASKNYVLVNAYPQKAATLKDVTLPGGWSWADNTIALKADNARAVQYYTATYKTEGAQAFTAALPVAVSEITSVNIVGSTAMAAGSDGEYSAVVTYKGYQPNLRENEYAGILSYQWTTEEGKSAYTIQPFGSDVVVTANAVESDVVQKLICTVKTGENTMQAELAVKVTKLPYVSQISFRIPEEQPENAVSGYEFAGQPVETPEIVVDVKNITKESNVLKVTAKALAGGQEVEVAKGFKWASSNTAIVAVKADADNSGAVLTFKKPGSAVIYVTAQDDGKYVQELLVNVKDYEPILDSKVDFDIYVEDGLVLPVKAQNGNDVTAIMVQEQDKNTKEWSNSSKVEVVKTGEEFYIKAKAGYAPGKNEKIKAQFNITTVNGGEYTKAVTISVNAKNKPKASLKVVEKAALVYKTATAVYQVSSAYEIASIEEVNAGEGFDLVAYVPEGNTLVFGAQNLNSETLAAYKAKKSPLCKVDLKVKFKGYTAAADQLLTLTVAIDSKAPALKMKEVTFFSGQSQTATQINYGSLVPTGTVSITSKTNGVGLRVADNGDVNVIYSGSKNKSYVAELTSANWTQPITVTGKIKVSQTAKQKLVMDTAKVTLNTAHNIQDNGKLAIGVAIPNNSIEIEKLSYQVDKKNQQLFNNGYLSITFSKKEQKAYIGLNKDMRGNIKTGTYKVNLVGKVMVDGREESLKPTPLTITLTDKAPQVNLKAKGTIDLVRRANTAIMYTPTYKNMTAVTESVTLSGPYADYFRAEVEDGIIYVSAQDGYPMSTKVKYPLNMTLGLDNGEEVTLSTTVKPVCKLPKVKAEVTKATLYKTSPEVLAYQVTVADALTRVDRVERVEDKNSQYFDFVAEGDCVSVTLTEEARKMKPGKYTISYQVYMEGAAYDAKPATLKLSIIVK